MATEPQMKVRLEFLAYAARRKLPIPNLLRMALEKAAADPSDKAIAVLGRVIYDSPADWQAVRAGALEAMHAAVLATADSAGRA